MRDSNETRPRELRPDCLLNLAVEFEIDRSSTLIKDNCHQRKRKEQEVSWRRWRGGERAVARTDTRISKQPARQRRRLSATIEKSGFKTHALASAISCRCPELKLCPPLETAVSSRTRRTPFGTGSSPPSTNAAGVEAPE